MVLKTELCRFSGLRIYPGKGIRSVRSDSQAFLSASSTCKRYLHNHLRPAMLAWTAMYREQHKKVLNNEARAPYCTEPSYRQEPLNFEQSTRYRRNIEMKRGDWICPKCQFMNFARNVKCLECDEVRPKRQLTGGEWECPQCDFFNYGRNMTCLRCDCKRPESTQSSTVNPSSHFGFDGNNRFGDNGSNADKNEVEHRLAENDEKAQRWFSKVSQLGDTSDLSSAIADEDFPEIMPMRKGVNRFVVSTRKTSLERRLANEQYTKNIVSDSSAEGTTMESKISSTLDRVLGQSTQRKTDNPTLLATEQINTVSGSTSSQRKHQGSTPFVPLPTDMIRQSPTGQQSSENVSSFQSNSSNDTPSRPSKSENPSDASISDTPGDLSGNQREGMITANTDDFPDIMPLRKGENRFVISKKKDRSLTSPQYKRRLATEQANGSNFVPFVPFPPGYFAKKDPQSETGHTSTKAEPASTTSPSENVHIVLENSSSTKSNHLKFESPDIDYCLESQQTIGGNRCSDSFGRNQNMNNMNPVDGNGNNSWTNKDEAQRNRFVQQDSSGRLNHAGIPTPSFNNTNWSDVPSMNSVGSSHLSQTDNKESWGNDSNRWDSTSTYSTGKCVSPSMNRNDYGPGSQAFSGRNANDLNSAEKPTQQMGASQSVRHSSFTGKSLEGSAVTEPDPLDMSEEAKAQRWFRRVAQITDISELSKIPDEDFPTIMPMRKGVNRFVVSKRKTPLERRLTSPQYRRNLPIVSSEPSKDSKQGDA